MNIIIKRFLQNMTNKKYKSAIANSQIKIHPIIAVLASALLGISPLLINYL